jgi:acetyl esterase/lipase
MTETSRGETSPAQRAKDACIALATRFARDPEAVAADLRAAYDEWTEQAFEIPQGTEIEPCRPGGVESLRVLCPPPGSSPSGLTLLHLHGGAYITGSAHAYRAFAARLSAGTGASVVLPEYRLAPEHGPLAALEDAVAAFRGLLEAGADPGSIVISGDSAGGGLALAALLALRDEGARLPAGGIAISPWADATLASASVTENAEHDVLISPALLSTFALMRLGPDTDRRDPRISPVFGEWHGIPPLLLLASSTETLRDDAVRVAERARDAGVNAQLEIYEDQVHVWPFFSDWLPEGRQAIDQIAAFLHACTSPPVRTASA